MKGVQNEIAEAAETRQVKVTYEMHNPDVDKQRRFFNGPVVEFFTIQSTDAFDYRPQSAELKQYRELLLFNMLGFDMELPGGEKVKQRKSTVTFQSTQKWHTFLEELKETYFDPNGYEMPDSEEFWSLADEHGYFQAQALSIEKLQRKLRAKLST